MNKKDRPKMIWQKYLERRHDKGKLLDCASGSGKHASWYYLGMGMRPGLIHCVDIDRDKLDVLYEKGCKIYQADLEKDSLLKFWKPPYFNAVVCSETLEHLSKKAHDRLLLEFLQLLKPKGSIIFTYPIRVKVAKKLGHVRQPTPEEQYFALKDHFYTFEINIIETRPGALNWVIAFINKK